MFPVAVEAFFQQAEPDQPVDIGSGKAANGKYILDGPRFRLDAQQGQFRWQAIGVVLIVVQPGDKGVQPGAGLVGQAAFNLWRGAAIVEDTQRVVDIDGEGTEHLAEPTLGDALEQRHLPKPQVGVDHAKGEGQIVIGFGIDEGNLVVVPANGDRMLHRRGGVGKDGETFAGAGVFRPKGRASCQKDREHGSRGCKAYPDSRCEPSFHCRPSSCIPKRRAVPEKIGRAPV